MCHRDSKSRIWLEGSFAAHYVSGWRAMRFARKVLEPASQGQILAPSLSPGP